MYYSEKSLILQMTILQMFASDMETYGRLVQTKSGYVCNLENPLRCTVSNYLENIRRMVIGGIGVQTNYYIYTYASC
jgi:hypothetical protein